MPARAKFASIHARPHIRDPPHMTPVFLTRSPSSSKSVAQPLVSLRMCAHRVFVNLLLQPCSREAQADEGANVMKALMRAPKRKVVSNFKSQSSVISRSRVSPGSKKRSVRDFAEGQADVTAADSRRLPPARKRGRRTQVADPGPRYKVRWPLWINAWVGADVAF